MRTVVAVVISLALVACRPSDQKTDTIDAGAAQEARAELTPAVASQLDSGNAAFRRKDYRAARRHYQAAVRGDAKQPAGWFGVYMVELAEGNAEAAQAALNKAQKLVPGATLIHPNRK